MDLQQGLVHNGVLPCDFFCERQQTDSPYASSCFIIIVL